MWRHCIVGWKEHKLFSASASENGWGQCLWKWFYTENGVFTGNNDDDKGKGSLSLGELGSFGRRQDIDNGTNHNFV